MAAPPIETYVGQTVNGLEVLKLLPRNASGDFKYWLRCPCKTEFSGGVYNVINGNTKSCGCGAGRKSRYERMPDDKLILAYTDNERERAKIIAAFEARKLPLPVSSVNGQT
jgi:hypothetical protein